MKEEQKNDYDFEHLIKTYITHNKGSSWELITAPEKDMKGKPIKCFIEEGCSLNLDMYSTEINNYSPPYSS